MRKINSKGYACLLDALLGNDKGYAYLLDALLGLVLFATMFNIAVSLEELRSDDADKLLQLTKIGNDLLYALDSQNNLRLFDSLANDIPFATKEKIKDILPANIEYNLKVKKYQYSDGAFDLNVSYTFSNSSFTEDVKLKRTYFEAENNQIKYYYVAELKLRWK